MGYGVWRDPPEETEGLYPGLVVADNRVSGSITTGRSRLPVWALVYTAIASEAGWDEVEAGWSPSEYGWDADRFADFVHDLLQQRGEFARLLLILADAERCERAHRRDQAWWETRRQRQRVSRQLRRCLDLLEQDDIKLPDGGRIG